MSNDSQQIVNHAWNFAHALRDDGLSYMGYTEQITFLLFLKMAEELSSRPYNRARMVPEGYDWPSLLARDGEELLVHYRHILEELGRQGGMLGEVFRRAKAEVQNPAILRRLIVELIDPIKWSAMDADVKGDIYEGLLAKSAEESPKGAGQYFTPRPLIRAIVEVMRPDPEDTLCDPASGTGGFLLAAHDYVLHHHAAELDQAQKQHLKSGFIRGMDIVPNTARLCVMNLFRTGSRATPAPSSAWTHWPPHRATTSVSS
jgi:type I restriction enzyme M protein